MRKILLSFSIAFAVVLTLRLENTGASKPVKNSSELKEYATYTISTTGSKKLLEISGELMQGDKLKDGAKLRLSPKPNTIQRWQKWLLSKKANGYFTIMNLNSGKYIGVSADKNLPGAELSQSRLSNMKSQYWMVTAIGNGSYKIVNKANELVITEQFGRVSGRQATHALRHVEDGGRTSRGGRTVRNAGRNLRAGRRCQEGRVGCVGMGEPRVRIGPARAHAELVGQLCVDLDLRTV